MGVQAVVQTEHKPNMPRLCVVEPRRNTSGSLRPVFYLSVFPIKAAPCSHGYDPGHAVMVVAERTERRRGARDSYPLDTDIRDTLRVVSGELRRHEDETGLAVHNAAAWEELDAHAHRFVENKQLYARDSYPLDTDIRDTLRVVSGELRRHAALPPTTTVARAHAISTAGLADKRDRENDDDSFDGGGASSSRGAASDSAPSRPVKKAPAREQDDHGIDGGGASSSKGAGSDKKVDEASVQDIVDPYQNMPIFQAVQRSIARWPDSEARKTETNHMIQKIEQTANTQNTSVDEAMIQGAIEMVENGERAGYRILKDTRFNTSKNNRNREVYTKRLEWWRQLNWGELMPASTVENVPRQLSKEAIRLAVCSNVEQIENMLKSLSDVEKKGKNPNEQLKDPRNVVEYAARMKWLCRKKGSNHSFVQTVRALLKSMLKASDDVVPWPNGQNRSRTNPSQAKSNGKDPQTARVQPPSSAEQDARKSYKAFDVNDKEDVMDKAQDKYLRPPKDDRSGLLSKEEEKQRLALEHGAMHDGLGKESSRAVSDKTKRALKIFDRSDWLKTKPDEIPDLDEEEDRESADDEDSTDAEDMDEDREAENGEAEAMDEDAEGSEYSDAEDGEAVHVHDHQEPRREQKNDNDPGRVRVDNSEIEPTNSDNEFATDGSGEEGESSEEEGESSDGSSEEGDGSSEELSEEEALAKLRMQLQATALHNLVVPKSYFTDCLC